MAKCWRAPEEIRTPDPQIRSLMLFRRGRPALKFAAIAHQTPTAGYPVQPVAQTKVNTLRTDNSVDEGVLHGRLLPVLLQQIVESLNSKGVEGGILLRCQYS